MTPAARYAAAIDILDGFLAGTPCEKLLSNWGRKNRYAGSKDRAAVRDIVFDCLRNLKSYEIASGSETGRGLALGHCMALGFEPTEIFSGQGYGPSEITTEELTRLSAPKPHANLPDWLDVALQADLQHYYQQTCDALSQRAPVDLRVNLARISRDGAISALAAEDIHTELVADVPSALRIVKNPRRLAGSQAYQDGLVELQDAASQAIVDLLPLKPEDTVLDYCAGGGGKTLAMAAKEPKAQYFAWDISAARLDPLEKRAKRAGVKVTCLKQLPDQQLFDLVLVDAPCSGSGAWRRNPEGKWRLTPERLEELQQVQAEVLRKSAAFVRPGGTLAYATCSIFHRENRQQVERFIAEIQHSKTKSLHFSMNFDQFFNISELGDGFYIAILNKQL